VNAIAHALSSGVQAEWKGLTENVAEPACGQHESCS